MHLRKLIKRTPKVTPKKINQLKGPPEKIKLSEHPFGIIKRQWGFSYILTKKGISRASAIMGFIQSAA